MLEQAIDDIRQAARLLRNEVPHCSITLVGICSGAMNAFHAALAQEGIAALVMFDGNMYPTWGTRWRRQANRFRLRSLRRAARLLTALIRRDGLMGAVKAAGADALSVPSEDSARLPIERYAEGLRQLVERGTKVHLLFSASFPAYYNHAGQFANRFRAYGLADKVSTLFLPHVDHVITLKPSQQKVIDAIDEWLSRSIPSGAAPKAGGRTPT